jgi:putative methanogen marker protein 4
VITLLDLSFEKFIEIALLRDCRIGIGLDKKHTVVVNESVKYCKKLGLDSIETFGDTDKLIDALTSGDVDAIVRGNLSAKYFITRIKKTFETDELSRCALLQTSDNDFFFLTPIGIDEGQTIESKMKIIENAVSWLKHFDIEAHVGVLSGGREEDKGRYDRIDYMITIAEVLTNKLIEAEIDTKNYGIRLEDAVKGSNIIVIPDGVIGNYIFRTLYHLGRGNSIGAPILNLPKVIVDTSRTKREYYSSIVLAAAANNVKI